MTMFGDLYGMPEEERIHLIGKAASAGNVVAVMLEKDEPEKVERYIRRVTEAYPGVVAFERVDGPTPSVVTVKFGRRQ